MKNIVIFPIPKTFTGRIGKDHWQDWYHILSNTKKLQEMHPEALVIIVTAMKPRQGQYEADVYYKACKMFGIKNLTIVRETYETFGQIKYVEEYQRTHSTDSIILVTSIFHFLRVKYLATTLTVSHKIAYGLPPVPELLTEPIMLLLCIFAKNFGKEEWLKEKIDDRRKRGLQQ